MLKKKTFFILFALLAFGVHANAHDDGTIAAELERLQRGTEELRGKIVELEARLQKWNRDKERQEARLRSITAGVAWLEANQHASLIEERVARDPELHFWRSLATAAESVFPVKEPTRAPAIIGDLAAPSLVPVGGAHVSAEEAR